jgi:crossover junction endodeoxyribonuclease RusA
LVKITLPYPPTVNTYWRNVKGRTVLSAKGRAYKANPLYVVAFQLDERPIYGRLSVDAVAYMPDARTRDLDNIWKPMLDYLTHHGVFRDDSDIDDLRIRRGGIDKANPRVELTITKIEEARP